MIGNDVVDLELSRKESNWQRKGFLDKIFTKNEQNYIQKSENQEVTVWNLWSRKEAAYKIWNRETGIRKFNPNQFECFNLDSEIGKIRFKSNIYFTKTEVSLDFIHSIAVSKKQNFFKIKTLENFVNIEKHNEIPFYVDENQVVKLISKSNHGRFEIIVELLNS